MGGSHKDTMTLIAILARGSSTCVHLSSVCVWEVRAKSPARERVILERDVKTARFVYRLPNPAARKSRVHHTLKTCFKLSPLVSSTPANSHSSQSPKEKPRPRERLVSY